MWLKRAQKNKYNPKVMAQRIEEAKVSEAETHLKGQKFFYFLRNIWGVLLAVTLVTSVFFQFWLTYQVGKNQLSFTEYKVFLGIVAGENFVQVIGLCAIVVGFLFPKKK